MLPKPFVLFCCIVQIKFPFQFHSSEKNNDDNDYMVKGGERCWIVIIGIIISENEDIYGTLLTNSRQGCFQV